MSQAMSAFRSFLGFCRRWFAAEAIYNPRSLDQLGLETLLVRR